MKEKYLNRINKLNADDALAPRCQSSPSQENLQDPIFGKLNELVPNDGFRLPTEAEWEYACRAGTTTPFWFGDQVGPEQVNYNGDYPYAGGQKGLNRGETVAVKALPCNGWGLYQMHGNVWEWCQDLHSNYLAEAMLDPLGLVGDGKRVLRGGSWLLNGWLTRSAARFGGDPNHRLDYYGFRLARGQTASELASKVTAFAFHESIYGVEAKEQQQGSTASSHDFDSE